MFAPSVTAGLLKPSGRAGYGIGQVFIRQSMHVPVNRHAVRDAMPALFDLLAEEEHPAVRVGLGHFAFVYIHPYMDGNGRMGRFLMNVMMAAGGYPWTVIRFSARNIYMGALQKASVGGDIAPFAEFVEASAQGAAGIVTLLDRTVPKRDEGKTRDSDSFLVLRQLPLNSRPQPGSTERTPNLHLMSQIRLSAALNPEVPRLHSFTSGASPLAE